MDVALEEFGTTNFGEFLWTNPFVDVWVKEFVEEVWRV